MKLHTLAPSVGAKKNRKRIGRGPGASAAFDDPRMAKIQQALEVLQDRSGGRAERIQQIFSLDYDPNWKVPAPR